jgi:hypothetical protein
MGGSCGIARMISHQNSCSGKAISLALEIESTGTSLLLVRMTTVSYTTIARKKKIHARCLTVGDMLARSAALSLACEPVSCPWSSLRHDQREYVDVTAATRAQGKKV